LGRRARSLPAPLPSACHHHQWRNLWVSVICSFNNVLPQLQERGEKKKGDGGEGVEDVQLAEIRFRLAGQITQRSDLLHFSTGVNAHACSHTRACGRVDYMQTRTHTHTHTHTFSPTLDSTTTQYFAYTPSKLTLIRGVVLAERAHKSLRVS